MLCKGVLCTNERPSEWVAVWGMKKIHVMYNISPIFLFIIHNDFAKKNLNNLKEFKLLKISKFANLPKNKAKKPHIDTPFTSLCIQCKKAFSPQ